MYVFINQKETETEKMNNYNDDEEDSLGFINRLLEQLHLLENERMKESENEKSIIINIYRPGSQHVDRVENQYIGYPAPGPAPKRGGELPEALSTEEAMALWEKVQKAGYVDDNYQPLISRTRAAVLADEIAERLEVKEKWKAFETLWNRRNMYRDYHDALNQRQSLQFRDKLRELFS